MNDFLVKATDKLLGIWHTLPSVIEYIAKSVQDRYDVVIANPPFEDDDEDQGCRV